MSHNIISHDGHLIMSHYSALIIRKVDYLICIAAQSHTLLLVILSRDKSVYDYHYTHVILCARRYTVMSLLKAPCAKTSWRALLFHAIFLHPGGRSYSVF